MDQQKSGHHEDSHPRPIPPEILSAIRTTFSNASVDEISQMRGGRSGALLFSVIVGGTKYVVRKADQTRQMHQERTEREFTCMTIAAEHGIAPKVIYTNIETGISIVEQIEGRGLERTFSQIERMAYLLRRLHFGPAFPISIGPVTMVAQLNARLREYGGHGLPESLTQTIGEVGEITARYAQSRPCHNDLNPTNIIATPRAIYLIDWENAGMSDPYLDLAQLGVFSFPTFDQREDLLLAYLGREPLIQERARTTLARVMALGVYAAAFFELAAAQGRYPSDPRSALSMPNLLGFLADERDRAAPDIVASSLLAEMVRESEEDNFAAAKRLVQKR